MARRLGFGDLRVREAGPVPVFGRVQVAGNRAPSRIGAGTVRPVPVAPQMGFGEVQMVSGGIAPPAPMYRQPHTGVALPIGAGLGTAIGGRVGGGASRFQVASPGQKIRTGAVGGRLGRIGVGDAPGIPYRAQHVVGGFGQAQGSLAPGYEEAAPDIPAAIRPGMPMGYYPRHRGSPAIGFQGDAEIQYQSAFRGQKPLQAQTPPEGLSGVGYQSEADMIGEYRDNQRIAGSGPYDTPEGRARWRQLAPTGPSYQDQVDERLRRSQSGEPLYQEGETRGARVGTIDTGNTTTVSPQEQRQINRRNFLQRPGRHTWSRGNTQEGFMLAQSLKRDPTTGEWSSDLPQDIAGQQRTVASIASRYADENGNISDYSGFALGLRGPFGSDPKTALRHFYDNGGTLDDIEEAMQAPIDNKAHYDWLSRLWDAAAGAKEESTATSTADPAATSSGNPSRWRIPQNRPGGNYRPRYPGVSGGAGPM